jgi:hypothetical protein
MDLSITGFNPSLPSGNSIAPSNKSGTNSGSKTDKTNTGFSPEAAIIELSPEAMSQSQTAEKSQETEPGSKKTAKNQDDQKLDEVEKSTVQKLQLTDLHVKMHEQQHLASAGSYAKGRPSFQYVKGPDGKLYAIGGEVAIDTSPIANNPQATIVKAQTIRRAALAPSDPSGADRSIAAAASQMEAQARNELANEKAKKTALQSETGNIKTGNNVHYYMKAYRNSLQCSRIGNYFNKIA